MDQEFWNETYLEDDLHSVEAYVDAMPELETQAAETRYVANAFTGDDIRGASTQDAYVTFIRASK